MNTPKTPDENLKTTIYNCSVSFLIGLKSGQSREELEALLLQIKEKELLLIKQEGAMLSPELWQILYNRFITKFGIQPGLPNRSSASTEGS